jgi:hypothetical protein
MWSYIYLPEWVLSNDLLLKSWRVFYTIKYGSCSSPLFCHKSYCIAFCIRILYGFFFILGVRGTFRWNHATSGKCHKCMCFLQSLIQREVSSAWGEGHISSYFGGISSQYGEARFVCLQWGLYLTMVYSNRCDWYIGQYLTSYPKVTHPFGE